MVNLEEVKNFNLSLFLCVFAVLVFYTLVPFDFAKRGDFQFHYEKSAGIEDRQYAMGSHLVGGLFAYNQQNFLLYVLILVWLITPMLLWHITKTWETVLFYFATQYPFFMLMTTSQAFAGIFFIGLFVFKNNYLRFLMVVGGAIVHGQGGILLLFSWAIILFFENFNLKKLFPACGTLLGNNMPDFLNEKLPIAQNQPISIATIGNFFLKIMPVPFLFMGLKQLWKDREFAVIFLSFIAFIAIFFKMDRTLYVIPLLILPYSAKYFQTLRLKWKIGVYLVAIALIGLQVYSWIGVKTICGG